jgi:hypothetical protein
MSRGKIRYRKAELYKVLSKADDLTDSEVDLLYQLANDPDLQRMIERQADTDSVLEDLEERTRGLTTDD